MKNTIFLFLFALISGAGEVDGQTSTRNSGLTLHPGDLIEIDVWREEDLSGEFLVDESGIVTLPLLGRVPVIGVPFSELRSQLLAAYAEQLRNPSISITPLRRVYVLGEVTEPGVYALSPSLSLAGAVALAGGATTEGNLRSLRVIREGQILVKGIRSEAALAEIGVLSGDQIFVDRHNWFDRNSTFLVSALLSVTSIFITLAR